jgi:hypothetical protein
MLVVVVVGCVALVAQEGSALNRVAQIRSAPSRFINERVELEGYVTQFVELGSQTTSFFYLKDDWGGIIKVRTSKDRPSVGKRYLIGGPVGLDPKTKDLYVSEESRVERFKGEEPVVIMEQLTAASPPKTEADATLKAATLQPVPPVKPATAGTGSEQPEKPPNGSRFATYAMLGGGAFVVLAVAGVMVFRNRTQELGTGDFSLASAVRAEPPPAPEQIIEGRTIKLHAPPPNTVKMMPSWFEVVSGDDVVKQIRFYKFGGEQGEETTFGRATGRPYVHVQLKAPTVSSRQAKVAFDGASAKLTNFAAPDSNPTRVNGRELAVNETVPLKENDRVEMGEVSLMFHESATARTLAT